jgi:hypothetical protein
VNSKAKIQRPKSAAAVIKTIAALARSKNIGEYIQALLVELCRIDTTPNPDVFVMRDAEDRCFQILERELTRLPFAGGRLERRPIASLLFPATFHKNA